jgi:hypothetical protein
MRFRLAGSEQALSLPASLKNLFFPVAFDPILRLSILHHFQSTTITGKSCAEVPEADRVLLGAVALY